MVNLMSDGTPSSTTPLTDKALKRFRDLAQGNGLDPADITLVETEEKTYVADATLTLTPMFETESIRYPGGPQGKNRKVFPSIGDLKMDLEQRRKDYISGDSWIEPVITELKAERGQGWGYHDATITLTDRTIFLAAVSPCAQCAGQQQIACEPCRATGRINCTQCHGNRQELCYFCNGSGQNPQQPGQTCLHCQGTRLIQCRLCQGQGQIMCPPCQGRGSVPCTECNATGQITNETAITCGAKTVFKIDATEFPSNLRRGLDRLEIVNLINGHADIDMLGLEKTEEKTEQPVTGDPEEQPAIPAPPNGEKVIHRTVDPIIKYRASIPFADYKVCFGKNVRPSLMASFGKKGLIMDVPSFLDRSLEPWREKLREAIKGEASMESVIEARAMHDAACLVMTNKGSAKELRKIYSLGLSNDTATEIIAGMRALLKKQTLQQRTLAAIGGFVGGTGLFALWFLAGLRSSLLVSAPPALQLLGDFILLTAAAALAITGLGAAMKLGLQKRFPDLTIPLQKEIGKTGYAMIAAIIIGFLVIATLAPQKPVWVTSIIARK